MSILSWILIGLLTGLAAGLVTKGPGIPEDIIVAVVGAIVGGWLFGMLARTTITELSLPGIPVALIGSTLFIALARGLTRGRTAI